MAGKTLDKLSVYRLKQASIDGLAFSKHKKVKSGKWKSGRASMSYHLFFRRDKPHNARWYSAFEDLVDIPKHEIPQNMGSGFILVVQTSTSCYGLTGGLSHSDLRKGADVDFHFGIELAQRIISLAELGSMGQRDTGGTVNSIIRRFRDGYNPKTDAANLRRILNNVTGRLSKRENPLYSEIGSSIVASDALGVNGAKDFEAIMKFIQSVDRLRKNDKKLITIPSLQRLSKRSHAVLIEDLESALVDQLIEFEPDRNRAFFLDNTGVPGFIDRASQFTVSLARRHNATSSVDEAIKAAGDFLRDFGQREDQIAALHRLKLKVEFDDGFPMDGDFLRHLCGDVVHAQDNVFLDCGSWYKADKAYLKAAKAWVDNIEYIDPAAIGLNEWSNGNEDDFIVSHKSMVLLHKRLVRCDGNSKVEFCDLLADDVNGLNVIHVKRGAGARLRELFAQGSVACTAYQDSGFQAKIFAGDLENQGGWRSLTAAERRKLANLERRQLREFKIVFAIFDDIRSHRVSNNAKTTSAVLKGTLSTFAMYDLLNHCRTIQETGMNVAVTRIRPYPTAVRRTKRGRA